MSVLLVVFLSTVMLHSVSAGGVYCAKTARARAAALGLDYPGVHGAPDLYKPAHYGMHHSPMPLRPYLYSGPEPAVIDPNVYPRSSDDSAPKQAHPWNPESTFQVSRGAYNPVQSEHATEQVLSFPRGQPVSNSESNFEEVKHVAPTRPETPSQSEFMIWERQGHTKPLQFVYNEHDLVFDKSVPNRHAMSLTGLPLPQSRGRGTYQRGLTRNGSGFGREVPVLGSTYLTNHPETRAMERRGPVFVQWERPPIGFPAHRARLLHRNNNVKQSVQGDLFPRLALKPVPVRISP